MPAYSVQLLADQRSDLVDWDFVGPFQIGLGNFQRRLRTTDATDQLRYRVPNVWIIQ